MLLWQKKVWVIEVTDDLSDDDCCKLIEELNDAVADVLAASKHKDILTTFSE